MCVSLSMEYSFQVLIFLISVVPSEVRLEAVQTLLLLLPCECRLALQVFLLFLRDIVDNSEVNQV